MYVCICMSFLIFAQATGFITVVNYRSLFFGDQEFQWRKCDWYGFV